MLFSRAIYILLFFTVCNLKAPIGQEAWEKIVIEAERTVGRIESIMFNTIDLFVATNLSPNPIKYYKKLMDSIKETLPRPFEERIACLLLFLFLENTELSLSQINKLCQIIKIISESCLGSSGRFLTIEFDDQTTNRLAKIRPLLRQEMGCFKKDVINCLKSTIDKADLLLDPETIIEEHRSMINVNKTQAVLVASILQRAGAQEPVLKIAFENAGLLEDNFTGIDRLVYVDSLDYAQNYLNCSQAWSNAFSLLMSLECSEKDSINFANAFCEQASHKSCQEFAKEYVKNYQKFLGQKTELHVSVFSAAVSIITLES